MHAATNGHSDCVRLLLESGADANAVNLVRIILFHFAVSFEWIFTLFMLDDRFE